MSSGRNSARHDISRRAASRAPRSNSRSPAWPAGNRPAVAAAVKARLITFERQFKKELPKLRMHIQFLPVLSKRFGMGLFKLCDLFSCHPCHEPASFRRRQNCPEQSCRLCRLSINQRLPLIQTPPAVHIPSHGRL